MFSYPEKDAVNETLLPQNVVSQKQMRLGWVVDGHISCFKWIRHLAS